VIVDIAVESYVALHPNGCRTFVEPCQQQPLHPSQQPQQPQGSSGSAQTEQGFKDCNQQQSLNGAQQQLQQPHQQEFHSSGQQQQQQQQQHIWVALDAVDGTLKLCGLGNEPGRARVVNDGTWAIGRWV